VSKSRETATLRPETRVKYYRVLVRAGRWLRQAHPEVVSPAQWTRALAAEFVAAVDRLVVGQWAKPTWVPTRHAGAPLSARAKAHQLTVVRAFFRDCQEWDWIPRRFAPARSLAVPRSVQALIAPNPRVLAADAWAKLLWAGLNLAEADLPAAGRGNHYYPPAMVRALAVVWLFGGLRSDEIQRLRVGCIRTAPHPDVAAGAGATSTPPAICLLEVPTHKTGPAFAKPVDRAVGEAILAWERTRPHQPASVDPTTAEAVQYLFAYRGRVVAKSYLNKRLIPLLCRKAGVPERDARGRITSHRARATIATQLFNAREPLSLFELQEWLGHRTPASTQHYAKITPTKLARSYASADYLQRNLRTVAVLIDQDAVTSGAAAAGAPWRFYDLGHGLCTYDFFDQCPHRMACAKCAFYRPKGSSHALLLEGKANLLRLRQDIPLTDDERSAVDDGLEALERLCVQLADVPTPAGPTPRELRSGGASGDVEAPADETLGVVRDVQPRVPEARQVLAVGEQPELVALDEAANAGGGAHEVVELQDRDAPLDLVRVHPRDLQVRLVDEAGVDAAGRVLVRPEPGLEEQDAAGQEVPRHRA
jgi:integrase